MPTGNPPDTCPGELTPTPLVAVILKVSSEQFLAISVPRLTMCERSFLSCEIVLIALDDELIITIVYLRIGKCSRVNGSSQLSSIAVELIKFSRGTGERGTPVFVCRVCVQFLSQIIANYNTRTSNIIIECKHTN